ncbi:MAG: hypothetical protein DMG40_09550 [Acidobacteria bacterium]|nr:MAG: hypothetical protein DMG40_09550 [Acidobacteriota bacterium]
MKLPASLSSVGAYGIFFLPIFLRQNGDSSGKRPVFPFRSYTRSIRHLVDIGALAEKEVIQ